MVPLHSVRHEREGTIIFLFSPEEKVCCLFGVAVSEQFRRGKCAGERIDKAENRLKS